MNYKLTTEQEARFEELYIKYKDKIRLVGYKCNISSNNFEHFYSHAMEGFLQSFLIMEAGDISQEDFPAFAYTNMKRKVIDELRRFARNKDIATDIKESYGNLSYNDTRMEQYIIKSSIRDSLNDIENRIFTHLEAGYAYKDISQIENISKSTYYNIVASIKVKSRGLLYKY